MIPSSSTEKRSIGDGMEGGRTLNHILLLVEIVDNVQMELQVVNALNLTQKSEN